MKTTRIALVLLALALAGCNDRPSNINHGPRGASIPPPSPNAAVVKVCKGLNDQNLTADSIGPDVPYALDQLAHEWVAHRDASTRDRGLKACKKEGWTP